MIHIILSSSTTQQIEPLNILDTKTAGDICYTFIYGDDNEINTNVTVFLYLLIPFFLVNTLSVIFTIQDSQESYQNQSKTTTASRRIKGSIIGLVFILPSLLIVTFYLALAKYVASPGVNNNLSIGLYGLSLTPKPNSVESIYPQVMGFYLMAIFLPILIFGTSLFVAIKNNRKNDYVTIGVLFIFSEMIANLFVYLLLSNGFFSMEMFVFFTLFLFAYLTGMHWNSNAKTERPDIYNGLIALVSITGILGLWLLILTIITIASNPETGFVYAYNNFCAALGSEYIAGDTALWFIFFFIVYIFLAIALSFVATSNTIAVEKQNLKKESTR